LHSPALAGKLHKVVRRVPAVVTSRLARFRSILLAGAGAAFGGPGVPSALGQDEFLATWLWDVTTQNGDAIVEPGETATITLSIDFTPNVGEPGKTGKTVSGLYGTIFDVLGGAGATNGKIIAWSIDPRLIVIPGDTTVSDGVSLFGTTLLNSAQFFVADDPITAVAIEWLPSTFSNYDVEYQTCTLGVEVLEDFVVVEWSVVEASLMFQVVPVPGTIALCVAMSALTAYRRRRSCHVRET
jgi:hypothetical protein